MTTKARGSSRARTKAVHISREDGLALILTKVREAGGELVTSLASLGESVGRSPATISDWLTWGEKEGLIRRDREGKKGTRIKDLCAPPESTSEGSSEGNPNDRASLQVGSSSDRQSDSQPTDGLNVQPKAPARFARIIRLPLRSAATPTRRSARKASGIRQDPPARVARVGGALASLVSWIFRERLVFRLACLAGAGAAGYYAYEVAEKSIDINIAFGQLLGASEEADQRWSELGKWSDIYKVLGFGVALLMWRLRQQGVAVLVLAGWIVSVLYGLNGSAGFASRNMADSASARGHVSEQREELRADIARKRKLIEAYEGEPAGTVAGTLERAELSVPRPVWRATENCTSVTVERSSQACKPILDLRGQLAKAREIEALETEVAGLRSRLNGLDTGAGPDAHFAMIADLLNAVWSASGRVDAEDIKRATILQIALLTELPAAAAVAVAVTLIEIAFAGTRSALPQANAEPRLPWWRRWRGFLRPREEEARHA